MRVEYEDMFSCRCFPQIHRLINECEKKHYTDDQIYHILDIIRSNWYYTILEDYIESISSGAMPFCIGRTKEITIESVNICFGPAPEDNKECIQKIVLCEDGKADITFMNYKSEVLREVHKEIEPEDAAYWLDDVTTHMGFRSLISSVTDVGSWSIRMVNDKNEEYTEPGPLLYDCDAYLDAYSADLRDLLDMPELLVFNNCPDTLPLVCSCEFTPGGKQYYYLSNFAGIETGDRVLVPVGKDNETKEVTVKDIIPLGMLEKDVDITKLKYIECIAEYDPVLMSDKLADMQKVNDDILRQILKEEDER